MRDGSWGVPMVAGAPEADHVSARSQRLSAVTAVVLVVVAGLSVGAWWVVRRGVAEQDTALLKNDTSQVVLLLEEAVQTVSAELTTLGTTTVESGDSGTVFAQEAQAIVRQRGVSVAVVDGGARPATVQLAAGPDLHAGQPLPAPIAAMLARARPELSASQVFRDGSANLIAFAIAPVPTDPGVVAIETSEEDPSRATPNATGPYSQIDIALYATRSPRPGQLIVSTTGERPLPAPTASATLTVGGLRWDAVGAAKAPLVGGSAAAAPWIVLTVGLLLAVALAFTVEILVRRQRHTARVVAQRERELLEAQTAVVRQERLSAVGQMATIIGHELRNPLGAAMNSLYLVRVALGDRLDAEAGSHLARAERETGRAAALSEDLTAYMRERPPAIVPVDLREVVDDVLGSTRPPEGIRVEVPEPGTTVDADRDQLLQVLINLVTNAYQAMPDGGTVSIAGHAVDGASEITVDDTGPGVPAEVGDRAFEPFVTTKTTGTGLGLAIVKQIVDNHGGGVAMAARPEGGTRVTLRLPVQGRREDR